MYLTVSSTAVLLITGNFLAHFNNHNSKEVGLPGGFLERGATKWFDEELGATELKNKM